MTIDAVAAEMRHMALASTDAIGYFAALYSQVTTRIGQSIKNGTFHDPEEMDAFACSFAGFYTGEFDKTIPRPKCWQATWDVASDNSLVIVQQLLLGTNAHVNHDLPLAVVAAADQRGDIDSIRSDFDAVNDVLAATYVDVQRQLDAVSHWTNAAASIGGGRLFNFSLVVARRQAWDAAERIYPLGPADRQRYEQELDRLVCVLAYLITKPPVAARPLLWLARRLEEHDPRKVTTSLLGDTG
jgi:hypothetical protein